MAYTKYSLTPANNTATPPDGAPEGMLPSAVNDTMRDMMAQIRDVGDGIRNGTYTMTAPVITGGSITGATVTSNTFSSSGATITGGTINGTAIGGTTAAAGKFTTLEATGVTTVQAGTVSAPAITTTGDTNTGIFFPAADTIAFTEGGVEAMRISSSGNLLVGSTSSTNYRLFVSRSSAGDIAQFTDGVAQTLTINSDASGIILDAPNLSYLAFKTNGSERMRIDSSGNVGIGTNNPSQKLDVAGNITGNDYIIRATAATIGYTGTNGAGIEIFGSSNATPNIVAIRTSNTERMRITSGGLVGIGTNNPQTRLTVVGGATSTQAIIGLYNEATAPSVGFSALRLGDASGTDKWQIQYNNAENSLNFYSFTSSTNRVSINSSGNVVFEKNISVGGVTPSTSGSGITFPASQSASSDANTLDDYEEGTWTPRSATNVEIAHAKYTKIGRVVTVSGTIVHTGSITSYDQITLPFAPSASGEMRYTGGVQFFETGSGTDAINIRLLTQPNISPNCFFWGQSGGQAWAYSMAFNGTNGVSQYTFTLTYVAA